MGNIGRLKGRRKDAFNAVVTATIRSEVWWVRNFVYSGIANDAADLDAVTQKIIRLRRQVEPGSQPAWVLKIYDPAFQLGQKLGLKYVKNLMFPVAIFCY